METESPSKPPSEVPAKSKRLERFQTIASKLAHGTAAVAGRIGWKKVVVVGAIGSMAAGLALHLPIGTVEPGEIGIRINRLTGTTTELPEGWALSIPGVHRIRHFPLRDRVYRPTRSASANGEAPYQSVEGLSLGVEVTVRYAMDAERLAVVSRGLPEDLYGELIQPSVDGVLHRVFATHTVREIFSTQRAQIQTELETELKPLLAQDGVRLRSVMIGNVDLPASYRSGLEALLAEELSTEKMQYTLELKDKQVKQTELEAEADKVRREKAAEAAGQEEIIAAKSKEEAMAHVLPFKEKEVQQRKLEADASKVARIEQAEAEAEARRIESQGEADSRKKLAEAEAYRTEVEGKAQADQMSREGRLLSENPLLIQKTLADKLSDKISVIIAPPNTNGFVAANVLGAPAQAIASKPIVPADATAQAPASAEGDEP